MSLVERDREIRLLSRLWTDIKPASGTVVVISGPVASGKTELLELCGAHMRNAGVLVLKAAASRTETGIPLGVIGQLVAAAENTADPDVAAARAVLGDRPFPWTSDGFDMTSRKEIDLLHALEGMLTELGRKQPVALCVDDVNYADVPSLVCLLYLARRLRFSRVMMLLSDGEHASSEYRCFQADLLREPRSRHIRLTLLSTDATALMLQQITGAAPAPAQVRRAHDLTGGNPLLLRALAEEHLARGDDPDGFTPGLEFSHAVTLCLLRCEYNSQNAARMLALLGDRPATEELVAELLAVDRATGARALRELVATGLLRADGRYRDRAVRVAVLASWAPARRAEAHRRLAGLLRDWGAPPAQIAGHLVRGGSTGEPWAPSVLLRGAEHALLHHDNDTAVTMLRAALNACVHDDERATITLALLRALWRTNPASAGRCLNDAVGHALAGRLTRSDSTSLLVYLLWFGRLEQAHALADALAGPADGTSRAVELWLGCLYPDLNRGMAGAAGSAETTTARRSAPKRAALLLSSVLRGHTGETSLTLAEQVLQGAQLDDQGIFEISAALAALIYEGRLDDAEHWCDSLLAELADRGTPTWQAMLLTLRSSADVRRGRMADAERHADQALALITPDGWGAAVMLPLANSIIAKTAMGRYEEAGALARTSVPEAGLRTLGGLHFLHARGRHHLATGRPHAALDDFQTCGDSVAEWGLLGGSIVPWAADAADALLTLGDRAGAHRLAAAELERTCGPRGDLLRVLASTEECAERRRALLEEAVADLEDGGDQYGLARACAELRRAYLRLGDEGRARAMENRAQDLGRRYGFVAHGAAPTRPAGPPGNAMEVLSEAERRVAVLAAHGDTNREIAAKLFITVSTVEQHLTRVYRKLDVGRRSELLTRLNPGLSPLESAGSA
ncbi:AAA family ATPase [Spirillospora albida]|uniref:AAA family ATPase n=1 Tax=Spirillospora albida TaxID=58123 RepID=UPI0014707194|nr:LuxR family transcriptional regulator [Spirillospora albida]